ncbi:NAD(P)-binding domain-containing protein [Allohahella sp. A8]|uniref:NAD(P)-binding domain-containing protein n=1 Tax=Allohahella sp. A8 TaxID=3141461 RepID=UPI003A80E30B
MNHSKHHKYIIIGAGPAGLQLGYHLKHHEQDYLILESDEPGSFFEAFPRHRKLISINKVFTGYEDDEINLRWDWNSLLSEPHEPHLFKSYTRSYFPDAESMPQYLADYAHKFNLEIRKGARVSQIKRTEMFEIELESGERHTCDILIMATGVSQRWLPDIRGIETADCYFDFDTDGEQYNNKRVLIIGKGNSAFETADALVEHASLIHVSSPNSLKMAWSTHYVGHLRAVNNNFLDTYQLKSQNAVLDAHIESIQNIDAIYRVSFGYQHAEGEAEVIEYDHVIACTGFRFDDSIFDKSCKPEMCERNKLPAQQSNWESTNIPDLYFAGTIMQYRDYKKYMSGFIHGFRYNVRTLSWLLAERYAGIPLPDESLMLTLEGLTELVIDRINRTSALWQQPGFLADVLILNRSNGMVQLIEELPVDYVHERWQSSDSEYFLLTLEFGQEKSDSPFSVHRIARDNVMSAEHSKFLHPIIRHFQGAELIGEHHVIEDLAAEWREPEHIEPLKHYFQQALELPFGALATAM